MLAYDVFRGTQKELTFVISPMHIHISVLLFPDVWDIKPDGRARRAFGTAHSCHSDPSCVGLPSKVLCSLVQECILDR